MKKSILLLVISCSCGLVHSSFAVVQNVDFIPQKAPTDTISDVEFNAIVDTLKKLNRDDTITNGAFGIGAGPDSGLSFDANGKIGATHYCDENGDNCTAATALAGSTGKFVDGDTATDAVFTGGNVGIGTATPLSKLFIAGDETSYASTLSETTTKSTLQVKTHASDSAVTTFGGTNAGAGIIQRSNGNGTTAYDLLLNPFGGNVGIGTSSPTAKLDVIGDIVATGSNTTDDYFGKFILQRSDIPASSHFELRMQDESALNSPIEFASTNGNAFLFSSNTDGDLVTITKEGNVGIGTTYPQERLQVQSVSAPYISLHQDVGTGGYAGIRFSTNEGLKSQIASNMGNNDLLFYTGANTTIPKVIIDRDGNVGIGTSNPQRPLHVVGLMRNQASNGVRYDIGTDIGGNYEWWYSDGNKKMNLYSNGNLWIAGTINQSSDERLKKEIIPLKNSLDKISNIRGVHYFWKDKNRDPNRQIGVIAQEVDKEFPELVSTDEDGIKSVNYAGLVAPLIEAVKEQQLQIESQNKRIKNLESQLKN